MAGKEALDSAVEPIFRLPHPSSVELWLCVRPPHPRFVLVFGVDPSPALRTTGKFTLLGSWQSFLASFSCLQFA